MVKRTEDKDRFGILENDKEENMAKIKDMTFGEALEAMKMGKRVKLPEWWHQVAEMHEGEFRRVSDGVVDPEFKSSVMWVDFTKDVFRNDWEIAEEPVVNKAFEEWYKQWTFDVMHSKKDMECAFNAGMVKITETFEKSKIEWLDGLIEKLGTVDPNYVVFSRGWESALSNLRRMANGGGYLVNYAVDRSGIGGEVPPKPEVHNLEWAKRMLKEGKRVRERRWSNRDASVIQSSASGRFYLFSQKDDTHPVPYIIEQSSEDSIWEIVE